MNASVEIVMCNTKSTNQIYNDLKIAFDIFNKEMFSNELPEVLFTLTRKKNTLGYFWADRFSLNEESKHEIALNPRYFIENTPQDTAFTLLHEMVHLWQQIFGKPSRNGYHNREWAEKMKIVGLQPISCDGKGSETGQKMSHEPIKDGKAFEVFNLIMEAGYKREIIEKPFIKTVRNTTRYKYKCSQCDQKVYGGKSSNILCGRCNIELIREE
ncbi:hypothetical protein F993_01678 [Acinetobacter proteolyticus]|uniref:SprT-like domain-containing protein n=1 Tax=Acinetobacter proteolyticus TaxID=1776741 RepID=A0ABN0JEF4_9GAMM|nr:SprT-like domain-containing protein [Acinetobacter proteolyticus]ENU23525.1 hypothetical protein F993_01678 [Acinetobacter proteolyticus]